MSRSVCTARMRRRAPRDFNGRTEVGSVAVKNDGRMESSPRIAEWDGPSRLPYYNTMLHSGLLPLAHNAEAFI